MRTTTDPVALIRDALGARHDGVDHERNAGRRLPLMMGKVVAMAGVGVKLFSNITSELEPGMRRASFEHSYIEIPQGLETARSCRLTELCARRGNVK